MNLHARYPALADLRARARTRIPRFVWEYLDSGTGVEATKTRNRLMLDRVMLSPSILHGEFTPEIGTTLFGHDHALPVGIAPVGMSGMVWPDAERLLARAATATGIPYTLSTVATTRPEDVAPHLNGQGWFQMYPPRDPNIRADMLKRARDAGFSVLVMTVDVPVGSRRERQVRSGLTTPPRLTPRLMAQVARCPAWGLGMARMGMPRMRLIDDYAGQTKGLPSNKHAGYLLRTSPDWDYLRCAKRGTGRSSSRACCAPTMPHGSRPKAPMRSGYRITQAASSTPPPPPSRRCPRSAPPPRCH